MWQTSRHWSSWSWIKWSRKDVMLFKQKEMLTLRLERQPSVWLLSDRQALLVKTQILFSCCFIQMFPNVLHSISALTRWNPTSIISRFSNRCLVKQFAMTYCFCMPLQDVIRCPGCSGLERSRGSSESSKEKRQWKTVQKHSLDQSKRRMLWKPMVLRQW